MPKPAVGERTWLTLDQELNAPLNGLCCDCQV